MAMEVHATSWAPLDHGSMTSTSGDAGATESQNNDRRSSNSSNPHDQDWAAIVSSCLQQQEQDPASSNNMSFNLFDIDSMEAHFGAVDDFQDHDPLSAATTSSSLSSSVCDPNGAPQSFQGWPQQPVSHAPPMMSYEQQVSYQPAHWVPKPRYDQQMNFGIHAQREDLGIQMPPTSHPIDIPGAVPFNRPFLEHESPMMGHEEYRHDLPHGWERPEHSMPPQDDLFGEEEERDGPDPADPCYAQLLYQCLREAPNHTLSLRELYDWVSQHSQKAKDSKNRGWQNSVRHNLSMNAAFARVPNHIPGGPKKGSLWRLTEDALRDGVISTTRYRKDPKRKPERRAIPALNRQASGAKGGRATRDATRYRQQQMQQQRNMHFRRPPQYSPYSIRSSAETSPQPGFISTPATSPYFLDDAAGLPLPHSAPQTPPSHLQFNPHHHIPYVDAKPRTSTSGFEFLPLDYNQHGGLFGNSDPKLHGQGQPNTPTPSLMTEASFMTDDNVLPSAVMGVCEGQVHDMGGYQ